VATAADGKQALHAAAAVAPAAILLDQQMPRLCGADVVRALRARGCAVPILLLSATADARQAAAASGADAFLGKPFDLDAVLALVARWVGTPATARPG
jgi:CheY-like chemotaxis protein